MRARFVFALAVLGGCGAVSSCAVGDDAADEAAATSSTDAETTSTGPPMNPTTLADDSSTGPPAGDGLLQCIETCMVPLDCCLPGMVACPGAYPSNVDCVDGLCVPPHCEDDDDCTLNGQVCRDVRGVATCVTPCADDPDVCTQPNTSTSCSGTTDDDLAFCFERCDGPGVFCGNQTCDDVSGLCVCEESADCPSNQDCVD